MSRRVDSLFAGLGGSTKEYPNRLKRYRIMAFVAMGCAVLGPLLWLSPLAMVLTLWAWFGVRQIVQHAKRLPEPLFLEALTSAYRASTLSLTVVFIGCVYHVWLLQQPWYHGGVIGALLRGG